MDPRLDKGQTIVEFAIVCVLFMIIIFGIIEFGRVWFYSNHLSNSVRAAARYGAALGGASTATVPAKVETYAVNRINEFVHPDDPSDLDVTVDVLDSETQAIKSPSALASGDTLRVTAVFQHDILTGSVLPSFSGVRVLTRSATMRFE